jgi:hypothetical protein
MRCTFNIRHAVASEIAMPIAVACREHSRRASHEAEDRSAFMSLLWLVLAVVLILWLFGAVGGIGGSLIHLLLVIALVVLVINLLGAGTAGGRGFGRRRGP